MKKVLVFSSLLALGAAASYGAPQACSTQSASALSGYTCEIGDKIFSNISLTGSGVPTTGTVGFAGGGTLYTLDFANYSAPITTAFTLNFTVAVDTVAQPQNIISQIQESMLTSTLTGGQIPNTSTAVVTYSSGGSTNLDGGSVGDQNGLQSMNTTSDTLSFAYTPGSNGKIADVQFGISQSTVPEPVSLSLTGLGLVGLGFFGRRRLKA
jgi:hypothetical protein